MSENPTLKNQLPKVIVMGGGSGTSVVLSGLKQYPLHLSAVISVADSGGATGRLRDEFGFQPVGDLRQSLAALSATESDDWIRKLLLYRFQQGSLAGQNLGNLILTALQDLTGSTAGALEVTHKIFDISGEILPVTEHTVDLVVEYVDGTFKIGEHLLDQPTDTAKKIRRVMLSPRAALYSKARKALESANLIIIGPGDYYASLQATLAVSGLKSAFTKTKAKIVYVLNLMTRFSQTHNMTAAEHVSGIEKRIGRPLDFLIVNNAPIPQAILKYYAADKEYPVLDDLGADPRVVRAPIASPIPYQTNVADTVRRSLLRHNQNALAKILVSLI